MTKSDSPECVNRLDDVADRLDHTIDAVRKRAQRIGACGYGPGPSLGERRGKCHVPLSPFTHSSDRNRLDSNSQASGPASFLITCK